MKKYVKVVFRDSKKMEPIFLSLEKWEEILADPKTLIAYKLDNEEEWTGRTLNKAEVIGSGPDDEYTKKAIESGYAYYRNLKTGTITKIPKTTIFPPHIQNDYKKI